MSHKFGIKITKNVQEEYEIVKETRKSYWRDSITKEANNCRKVFQKMEGVLLESIRDGKVDTSYK